MKANIPKIVEVLISSMPKESKEAQEKELDNPHLGEPNLALFKSHYIRHDSLAACKVFAI